MVIYPRALNFAHRGSVLIYALGMTALVSALSTAMILSLKADMRWVDKQSVLMNQRSSLMAIEAKAMIMLSSQQEKKRRKRSFELTASGMVIKGELSVLSNDAPAWDKKIPVKGPVAVLHTTIKGPYPLEAYSILNKKDKRWQVVYRSHGART